MPGIAICNGCERTFPYRKHGEKRIPKFCSLKCRKFENYTYAQKLEVLKRSFEKDVIRKEGCWDWKGTKHEDGYAKLSVSYKIGIQSGHGASYIIYKGKIPSGKVIRHKCFNPICTNPDHLEIGTPKQNIRDSVKAGRNARGSRNNKAKLSEMQVKEIRNKMKNCPNHEKGNRYIDLSIEYGVSKDTVEKINNRRSWKHVSP